jgi:hypothetical protein
VEHVQQTPISKTTFLIFFFDFGTFFVMERFVEGQRSNSIDIGAVGLLGPEDDGNIEEERFAVAPSNWYVNSAATPPETGENKSIAALPKLAEGARGRLRKGEGKSFYFPKSSKAVGGNMIDEKDESPTATSKARRRNSIGAGAVGLFVINDDGGDEIMGLRVAPSDWYVASSTTQPQVGESNSSVIPKQGEASRRSSHIPKPKTPTRKSSDERDDSLTLPKGLFRRRLSAKVTSIPGFSREEGFAEAEAAPLSPRVGERIGNYVIVKIIGRGGEGTIYLVSSGHEDATETFALKRRIFHNIVEVSDGLKEVLAMAYFSASPFCVALNDVFQDGLSHGRISLSFVMDYCVNGDLLEKIVGVMDGKGAPLTQEQVKDILFDVGSGLHAIHGSGFSHRDIKLENILIGRDGRCKICDFGLATRTIRGLTGFVGSIFYASPEMEINRNGQFTSAVDIWALGIVALELASSCVYKHKYGVESLAMRTAKETDFNPEAVIEDLDETMKDACGATIASMLQRYPEQRATSDEVLKSLGSRNVL